VLTDTYRELFIAVATCAAGLIGLLFVAISVSPREEGLEEGRQEGKARRPVVIQEIRAASALLSFSSALAIALFGVVPGSNAGYAAVPVGVIGILFTVASVRSILTTPGVSRQQALRQSGLILALLLAFGCVFCCGIGLWSGHTTTFGPELLSNILVALLLLGIARAWELVGNRDTGILSSLAVLTGRDHETVERADSSDVDE
jgi:hypothetical protein